MSFNMLDKPGFPREIFYENEEQILEGQNENMYISKANDPYRNRDYDTNFGNPTNVLHTQIPQKDLWDSIKDCCYCLWCWPLILVREDRIRREYGQMGMF